MIRRLLLAALAVCALAAPARALPPETLRSVVSVLPVWPGEPQGGSLGGMGAPQGTAPEGSGVVIGQAVDGGLIATAWHVVAPAERIDVRLEDGRILPARLVGHDAASDIALLKIAETLPVFELAPEPALAEPVCAIGNAYGLGLSVACGVVSALNESEAGFNAVEDFVQTDAAANPGSSGGALVDVEGRLVGMVSAIFASKADANIGVNFAVSGPLLRRVVEDLKSDGTVEYVSAGWRLERLSREARASAAGARVAELAEGGAADAAGVEIGDVLTRLDGRRILSPRDAVGALALVAPGGSAEATLLRGDETRTVTLAFGAEAAAPAPAPAADPDCPHPEPVCRARQAVFPVRSFDPLASSVRIAPDLLVTNRHVVADEKTAVVVTPNGPRQATVIASAYAGDLTLLSVEGLPENGIALPPEAGAAGDGPLYAVGADIARREVRVFEPGALILPPAEGAPLGRLHVTAAMQPGVSGGALVDESGRLAGIAVGGGDGRFEAIPAAQVVALLRLRDAPEAARITEALGAALDACAEALDAARAAARDKAAAESVAEPCRESDNAGQLLEAGRALGMAGLFDQAIALHSAAVAQTPNAINARLSLLTSLQLGGRFEAMLEHARWLLEQAPDDPQALRFAIQSGVWGGDAALAERAYAALETADPRQAQAARRFIDNPPPAPQPR